MIYHLTTEELLLRALEIGVYKNPSLKTEGFIHCSPKEEVLSVAKLHYDSLPKMIVLSIVEKRLTVPVKWENGLSDKLFPRVYGSIPAEAIESIDLIEKNESGEFVWITKD